MTDFYKTAHGDMFPWGTTEMTCYWTARKARDGVTKEVIFFGLQGIIQKYLAEKWSNFFINPDRCINEYMELMHSTFGYPQYANKFEKLAKLGYLPLSIKALPEGSRVPIGCPMVEVTNTHPDFAWLPGYIETLISSNLWFPITSATTAKRYHDIISEKYSVCGENPNLIPLAVSDFSMRGHTSTDSAEVNGAAHLLFFNKTANIPSIDYAKRYYFASNEDFQNAGTPSTEHSVMCAYGGPEKEIDAFKKIIEHSPMNTKISIVSDTYDLWNAVMNIYPVVMPIVKENHMVLICRPDSGDPVKIVCGDADMDISTPLTPRGACVYKGLVETLWDMFGGTCPRGYKLLDKHIRVIYGDAITPERCVNICDGLMRKGFSASNVIFGVGSYSYQYVTRDTYNQAYKATHAVVEGMERMLYKNPATDTDSMKKSQKGLCVVSHGIDGKLTYTDGWTRANYEKTPNLLQTVFLNGRCMNQQTFEDIRKRCRYEL
jgi:nicotinamide phosphoribosyltransferase